MPMNIVLLKYIGGLQLSIAKKKRSKQLDHIQMYFMELQRKMKKKSLVKIFSGAFIIKNGVC